MSSSPTDQLVEVTMPQMGISVSEGTILEWRKRPGDWVEADEVLCDVTTDKVDVEIPSPAAGRLERILAEPDQTVPVGEPIAEIDTSARAGEAHRDEHAEGTMATEAPANGEADRSGFYSPVVRRMAAEHDIDLDQVEGHGVGGRVRKRDLVAHINRADSSASRPGPARSAVDETKPVAPAERKPMHIESPYAPEPEPEAAPAPAGAPDATELLAGRREPMSPMRKTIAEHMLRSRHTAAHCTTIVEVDFSAVARRRSELKESYTRRGVPLTYLSFVARATVEALEEFPILNASVDGDEIVYHDQVNLGIAVALEEGLIVPVISNAERLSLEGMAAAISDVAERARAKRLEPDEVHGGTFTITNPGQFGAVIATPIINQPQVAILDLEAIVKRPVVVSTTAATADAEQSSGGDVFDSITIRPMAYLPLSFDHRALDGATAARFLARVKELLESGVVQ